MSMRTFAANSMRDIEAEVNKLGLSQDRIVNIFQTADGTFLLIYYAE